MNKFTIAMIMTIGLMLTGCGESNEDAELDTIILGGGDWDSVDFHNAIAEKILEDGYDYDVEIVSGSTPALMQGIRQDDIHILMELWTDTMKEAYEEGTEAGEIDTVGLNFEAEGSGFYVPTYVIEGDSERGIDPVAPDLETVEDMKEYPDLFEDPEDPNKGIFYNGPSSWSGSKIMDEKFEAYELGEMYNNFSTGSQAGLTASLESAYNSGEPWFGFAWSPTPSTAKFDLTLLKEAPYDKEIYEKTRKTTRPPQEALIITSSGFEDRAPDVVEFLGNYETSDDLTEQGIAYIINNDSSAEEAAEWWMNKHEDVWMKWVSDEVAEKVKKTLSSQ